MSDAFLPGLQNHIPSSADAIIQNTEVYLNNIYEFRTYRKENTSPLQKLVG
jgi:hypothetical protein